MMSKMVKTFDLCKISIGLIFTLKIVQIDDFWGRYRLKRSTSACLCVFHDTRMSGPPLLEQEFHVKCGFSPTCKKLPCGSSCAAASGPLGSGQWLLRSSQQAMPMGGKRALVSGRRICAIGQLGSWAGGQAGKGALVSGRRICGMGQLGRPNSCAAASGPFARQLGF